MDIFHNGGHSTKNRMYFESIESIGNGFALSWHEFQRFVKQNTHNKITLAISMSCESEIFIKLCIIAMIIQ